MLSPVVEREINKYYKARQGNPAGIPVEVLGINTDQTSSDNTDEFIASVGFEVAADDPDWITYGQFGPGVAASRYVIINGVADSPTHKQWEVLFNETFFQPGEVNLLRALIDKVQAPVPAPPKIAVQPQNQDARRGRARISCRVFHGFKIVEACPDVPGQPIDFNLSRSRHCQGTARLLSYRE